MRLTRHFKAKLLTGFFVFIPVLVTLYVVYIIVSFLDGILCILRWRVVKRGVSRLPLRPSDGADWRSIALLQEQERRVVIHNADGDADVALLRLGFRRGNHGLDGRQVQVFFGRQFCTGCRHEQTYYSNQ